MTDLSLPPLFTAVSSEGADPLAHACRMAREGCDPGVVVHDLRADALRAAIIFAPEVPLREACILLPLCGIGFQNALGALAPPEVGVHLEWDGRIRVNGGVAGQLKMVSSTRDAGAEPDWMVVSLGLALWPEDEETGLNPDVTALFVEGCADVQAPELLEAWARHTLVWINRWLEDGPRPIHTEWKGLAHGVNAPAGFGDLTGTFLGVDENFGMILKSDGDTTIIPLTDILTEAL